MNIFITGVSSGIGHALAKRYLDQGETVYGVSRRKPEDLASNPRFHFAAHDLGKLYELGPVVDALVPQGTALDVVVLNAGILGEIQDLKATSFAELRGIMDVNVWSCKALLDCLWARGATIGQVV